MNRSFSMPVYRAPDFSVPALAQAPDARWQPAEADGVAPAGFHSTSMYPEYFKIGGRWTLVPESRMDSSVVLRPDGSLAVVENRNLRQGDLVALGRTENGEEGIYLHTTGFTGGGAGRGTGSPSARAAAGRPPTPGTMTGSWRCCGMSGSTATSSGSWVRLSPLTPTPGRPCRP